MRLLFAAPELNSLDLMQSVLSSALCLTPLTVSFAEVRTLDELEARVEEEIDDVILLDWDMVHADTPALVTKILSRNPKLRLVVLLPESSRQYRRLVWEAGACNGIPKEFMDQEWLSTVLCIMHRAIEREAKYNASLSSRQAESA
jgi:DNA-binding NarL/FixJ family response regulator